jgi:hypothetical protein
MIKIDTAKLLSTSASSDAMNGWGEVSDTIRTGQKIRVTFTGSKPKSGYAYRVDGLWLGIRYTWKSMRWWSLLNYNNPLVKLEVEELATPTGEKFIYRTLWEREGE